MPKKASAKKGGLSAKTFSGLNKKRMEKKAMGVRLFLQQGNTVPIQFLQKPEEFIEYEIHSFQEDGRWEFVPCAGDACPLCQEDDEKRKKTGYRFCCNVYNLDAKRVQILEGPKDLAGRIFFRYERKPATFLKKTYEVTKFATTPVSYQLEVGEEPPVKASGLKLLDLEKYLEDELKRYYGDEGPDASALESDEPEDDEDDDDDDLEDEDEDDEEDEDDDLDDDDEDEDEDDLDDDDEDEEEDEPPAKKKRAPAKSKTAAKPKTAAKKRR